LKELESKVPEIKLKIKEYEEGIHENIKKKVIKA
jgi:hypothetical protein